MENIVRLLDQGVDFDASDPVRQLSYMYAVSM